MKDLQAQPRIRGFGRLLALALCALALVLALIPGHTPGTAWCALGLAITGFVIGAAATFLRRNA
jgi:hypothetical protein